MKKINRFAVKARNACLSRKILLMMKLTIFLLLFAVIQVLGLESYSQGTKLTLNFKNTSLKEILASIENQSEFYFMYSSGTVDVDRKVEAVQIDGKNIFEVLDEILKNTNIEYTIKDRQILLTSRSYPAGFYQNTQQQRSVTGKVTDESGEPVPGVSVVVKGTSKGTITDTNGNYSLTNIPSDATLVFSFVGMKMQEVQVEGMPVVNLTMEEETIGIGEIVAIGYGTESAKKLTTSVSSIRSDKLNDLPIANIANAFTGNVSGVIVEQGSGAPGSTPVIRVRGYGSINAGSEPLYVIDGMIATSTEFALLNPKSVESVNILKDAAAGAIYGSRAGNGVVIVTTKSGEGKAKFTYNSTIGLQHVEKKIPVLSGPEYIAYSKEAYQASGEPEPFFSPDAANTNWQDEIFRTGLYQNHQISANGSSENVKYNVSFNYLGEEGIILTTYENNYSSNGNFNFKLSNKLQLGLTYSASYTKGRVNNKLGGAAHGGGGILEDAIVQYPVIPVYMPNGDYGQQTSQDWGSPVVYSGYGNPVAGLLEVFDYRSGFSGMGRTFVNYEPIQGLNFNISFSGLVDTRYRDLHESPYLAAQGHPRDANFSNPRYDAIVAEQENSLRTGYTTEGFINYKRMFSNNHNFGIIAGFSNEYRGYKATSAWATENDRGANAEDPLPRFDNYLRPNIFGANDIAGGGGYWEETFVSLFARVNYDFKDKYLFMASIRRDGSSKFAPGNRYGVFPALSAAWRMTEESFMNSQNLFDDLKLRLSFGVSGNDQIGNYAWQGRANFGGFQYFYGPGMSVTTAYPSTIENVNLKWETNKQYNVGLDFGILNSRISLASDFYVRNTKDLLLNRPLPSENGISNSVMDNIGNVKNTGIELALTTVNISGNNFEWTTNWIFNKVWSKATNLFTETGKITLGSGDYDMVWIREGHEMFEIWGYKSIGIFESEEQLEQYPRPRGSKIGDPIYEEVVKDRILNSEDYQLLGHGLPNFTFGLTNTFRYKNLDMSIVVDGSQGASKYVPAFRNQSWVSPIEGNLAKYIYDRAGTVYGAANLDYSGNRLERNSYHVFDASYVRIKNLTIGYNLPESICNSLSISGLRLTFAAQNLYTFTSYPWYNPQANYFNGSAGTAQFGVDYGSYPLAKSYTVGINLTF
jgi:TonB-linked SusC/RagA family outer membrane protein